MKRDRWMRHIAVTSLIALPLFTAGCSLIQTSQTNGQIDPPQTGTETEQGTSNTTSGTSTDIGMETGQNSNITVYLKDAKGYVAPVSLNVGYEEGIAKKSLLYMVEDGEYKDELPAGFTPLLPKGTKLTVDIKENVASVDFSNQFADYNGQDERKILEAITWTLTGFPNVNGVKLSVNGTPLKEMPVNGTPLDGPLTRTMGINVEKANGVEFGEFSAVTLYFSALSPEDEQYYVPVTRLVKRTDSIAKTAIEQLIAGPANTNILNSVIMPTVKVLDFKQQDDTVTVNLSDDILSADNTAPAELLQSVVLSLTENTGAKKVQILVNGQAGLKGTDNSDYSKPVDRPTHVNALKL